ncbi:MAG: translation initiation factor IF-1 [Sorangium cellulosum]|nr:MAG: translation initiation factor IF-1 [Sorangium cellulosum]
MSGNRRETERKSASEKSKLEYEGIVSEALPNAMYRIQCDKRAVLAIISSQLRRTCVKILPGDRVIVEVSPYDPNRGRVTFRHK